MLMSCQICKPLSLLVRDTKKSSRKRKEVTGGRGACTGNRKEAAGSTGSCAQSIHGDTTLKSCYSACNGMFHATNNFLSETTRMAPRSRFVDLWLRKLVSLKWQSGDLFWSPPLGLLGSRNVTPQSVRRL